MRRPLLILVLCISLMNIWSTKVMGQTNTSPTLELFGPGTIVWVCGSPFDISNLGYTASDIEDGDLTAKVQVSGLVNVCQAGTYTITYMVEDSGGAIASAERSIIVTPPCNEPDSSICITNFGGGITSAKDDFAETAFNTAVNVNVLANDAFNLNGLDIVLISQPTNGTAFINAAQEIAYTPNFGHIGFDKLDYALVFDGEHLATATVMIGVGVQLNKISGYIFKDDNEDCTQQTGEKGFEQWMVFVEPIQMFFNTDENGYYEAYVGEGTFTIKALLDGIYWGQACGADGQAVTFEGAGQEANNTDFPVTASLKCPYMTVDIGTVMHRLCFDNWYTVKYSNEGSITAENATVEVTFDEDIEVLESTAESMTLLEENVYEFALGNVEAGKSEKFTVTYKVCNENTIVGSSICAAAHIYPDAICQTFAIQQQWDGSSLEISGQCLVDEVIFTIKNTGDGDMSDDSPYRFYEDNVLLSTGSIRLNSGTQEEFNYTANGKTFRMDVEQSVGNPLMNHPQAIVELCGDENGTMGLMNSVGHDDRVPFIDVDCGVIIASYDPNDKLAVPSGVGTDNSVLPSEPIEYTIRFQNTGTDTAFTVVIVDTLTKYLDVATVKSGVSSHDYEFKVYGNVLVWTFNNILLPDSTTNEPGSNGFVKFKIAQAADNGNSTIISNEAAIYFDFNEAIITEPVELTINEKADFLGVSVHEVDGNIHPVHISPNPAITELQFDLSKIEQVNQVQIEIYDLLGKKVKQINQVQQLQTNVSVTDLSNGVYVYRIISQQNLLSSGKIFIEK